MAITFVQRYPGDSRLFEADAGPGRLLFLPAAAGYPYPVMKFEEAWTSSALCGSFLYASAPIGETAQTVGDLVAAVQNRVARTGAARGFVWAADPTGWQKGVTGFTDAATPMLGFDAGAMATFGRMAAQITAGVVLVVADKAPLTLVEGTTVRIDGAVQLTGVHAPVGPASPGAELRCAPGLLGELHFDVAAGAGSLLAEACWGFQYVHPAADPAAKPDYAWYAFASGAAGDEPVGFWAVIDPSDPLNTLARPDLDPASVRSRLKFTGQNPSGAPTALFSTLRTRQGAPITLYPRSDQSALVFTAGSGGPGRGGAMQLAPMGDFELSCDPAPDPAGLLCGLLGTEIVSFHPRRGAAKGDLLRFTPYQPAYAPRFPFPDASPVTAPVEAEPTLLDGTFTTSWATVVSSSGAKVPYVAQPRGGALFGQGDPIWKQDTGLMGWTNPADPVTDASPFPLVPYAATGNLRGGTFPPFAVADFEREVVGPTRRRRIPTTRAAAAQTAPAPAAADVYTAVTPSGLLATVQDGVWTLIQLAQTLDPARGMYFCNPGSLLQQAFQSGDLLLVAANAVELGEAFTGGNGRCAGPDPAFANVLEIGGWELTANVGTRNHYADYSNVLIVKGRRGKLYDRADPTGSLLSNPERWTEPGTFAAPADLSVNPAQPPSEKVGEPVAGETVVLAQWLKDYFAAADQSADPDLAHFTRIAQDENWTGILVLRADITKVPADLVGITAGVADPAGFHAHHLGIEITPVSTAPGPVPGPTLSGASSLFGLIDYTDPDFDPPAPGEPAQPVAPGFSDGDYSFRLLSLKVVFANTAVSSFRSYAQLSAAAWFDSRVDHMSDPDNPYGAIVLQGTLQNDDGQPVYSMSTDADTVFYFDHDVLGKLEITGAVMSTRDDGQPKDTSASTLLARSWFGLTGFLDFKLPKVPDTALPAGEYPFDVYSFGSDPGEPDALRRGLAFSNLGVLMTFPPEQPADSVMALVADEIRFDVTASTPRPGSLFRQFTLDLAGLRSGGADTPPSAAGYSGVVTPARLTGVDGETWWGVDYRLPLGTPGNLAGRVALSAHLLTAWAADPDQGDRPVTPPTEETARTYRAAVALSLPGTDGGARLIALQNVLKLSVGQIRLLYDTGPGAFLLLFSEIALKLYGLLSIPPGSTLFTLFGDRDAAAPSDGGPSGLGWYAMYRKDTGGVA